MGLSPGAFYAASNTGHGVPRACARSAQHCAGVAALSPLPGPSPPVSLLGQEVRFHLSFESSFHATCRDRLCLPKCARQNSTRTGTPPMASSAPKAPPCTSEPLPPPNHPTPSRPPWALLHLLPPSWPHPPHVPSVSCCPPASRGCFVRGIRLQSRWGNGVTETACWGQVVWGRVCVYAGGWGPWEHPHPPSHLEEMEPLCP